MVTVIYISAKILLCEEYWFVCGPRFAQMCKSPIESAPRFFILIALPWDPVNFKRNVLRPVYVILA